MGVLSSVPQYGHSKPLLLPRLKDPTVAVGTKRRSQISRSLRVGYVTSTPNRGTSITRVHFRQCCTLLPKVLDPRMQRGLFLSPFEFFSYEEGYMGKPTSTVSHVDLAECEGNLVEREVKTLQKLVDGPVVFSGYRFFTDA